ncbi:substrate-binding domain-containing protein [Geminicoccus flavidas]|uniref:substrate-binding domain-containing protein n=1 Tax=Geminicoccus flavidas TaxID=2506407 RepID=UPI00135A8813|nr:substrate-binding domain-containing protein [Geminicoccus flavidas]
MRRPSEGRLGDLRDRVLLYGPGEHGGGDEQFQVVQDLIARGVDGIAVPVANAPAIAKAAQAAKGGSIPFVTWGSDLLDQATHFARPISARPTPRSARSWPSG